MNGTFFWNSPLLYALKRAATACAILVVASIVFVPVLIISIDGWGATGAAGAVLFWNVIVNAGLSLAAVRALELTGRHPRAHSFQRPDRRGSFAHVSSTSPSCICCRFRQRSSFGSSRPRESYYGASLGCSADSGDLEHQVRRQRQKRSGAWRRLTYGYIAISLLGDNRVRATVLHRLAAFLARHRLCSVAPVVHAFSGLLTHVDILPPPTPPHGHRQGARASDAP